MLDVQNIIENEFLIEFNSSNVGCSNFSIIIR